MYDEAEAAALLRYIKVNLTSLEEARLPDEYYYASLPLCVIDAVFSIGVRYESTRRTVKHWCQSQVPAWPTIVRIPSTEMRRGSHTIRQFINMLKGKSFELIAQTAFNNRQRTSTRNGILKAEAVYKFAMVLEKVGIDDFNDMVDQERTERAKSCVIQIEGQKSWISFDYLQMLAGSDYHVKADRMLRGFVADALIYP